MRTVLPGASSFVELPLQKGLPFPLSLFVRDNEFFRLSCFNFKGKFIVVYLQETRHREPKAPTWSVTNPLWPIWYF